MTSDCFQTETGPLPAEWRITRLGDCLTSRPSYGINAAAVAYSDRLPTYIRITDISEDGRFAPSPRMSVRSPLAHDYFLADGDIVFARTGGSVGKSYRYDPADGALVYAGFLICVRPDPGKLLPAFAAAYATTGPYWRWVRLMSMRSGQPGINGQEYAQLPIPLPPLAEQRAIAAALSDVDALLAGLDRLIAKKRDLKQAAMQQLLTGQTRLPGFQGEWEQARLGQIAKIQRGASPRPIDSPVWFDENSSVGWVRISDVTRAGMFLDETTQRLSSLGVAHSRPVASGSLIMSICATVGRPGITKIDVCIHDGFVVFDGLTAEQRFVYYVLKWIEPAWSKHGQTGSQMNLNTGLINGAEVLLPPRDEQVAIAAALTDMDAELAALESRRDKTRALKQGMMQELLTGRTRLA